MKVNDLIKYKGIYHQIFGDILEKLIYKNNIIKQKNIIKALGFKDVDDIFSDEIEKVQFNYLSKIIFRFYGQKNDKTDPNK